MGFRDQFDFPPFKRNSYIKSLVSEAEIGAERVVLLLPQTFMNRSGEAVRHMLQYLPNMPEIIVVHDELDLPLGRVKLSFGRGAAGHNGVTSIINHIGDKEFIRVRIGIAPNTDTPNEEAQSHDGRDFVLGRFSETEKTVRDEARTRAVQALEAIIKRGRDAAMQEFNSTT
jgi:PTH1 family peptidyl-tRNA hydrolase